jgi:hypothetical protein
VKPFILEENGKVYEGIAPNWKFEDNVMVNWVKIVEENKVVKDCGESIETNRLTTRFIEFSNQLMAGLIRVSNAD